MSERGEFVIRLEHTGSRWLVMGRWTLWGEDRKPQYESDIYLGHVPTLAEALQVAGLFGAGASMAVARLAKDAKRLEDAPGRDYNFAGIATLHDANEPARNEYRAAAALRQLGEVGRSPFTGNCPDCSKPLPANIGDCHTGACKQRTGVQLQVDALRAGGTGPEWTYDRNRTPPWLFHGKSPQLLTEAFRALEMQRIAGEKPLPGFGCMPGSLRPGPQPDPGVPTTEEECLRNIPGCVRQEKVEVTPGVKIVSQKRDCFQCDNDPEYVESCLRCGGCGKEPE